MPILENTLVLRMTLQHNLSKNHVESKTKHNGVHAHYIHTYVKWLEYLQAQPKIWWNLRVSAWKLIKKTIGSNFLCCFRTISSKQLSHNWLFVELLLSYKYLLSICWYAYTDNFKRKKTVKLVEDTDSDETLPPEFESDSESESADATQGPGEIGESPILFVKISL